jgi:predicted nucleotidyltransferase
VDQPQHLLKIIEALNAGEVRYVIIGGIAMRLHGSSHVTDDVDICYSRNSENLQALAASPAGIASFDGLWERSNTMEIHVLSVHVASLDDLIAMKRAAGRIKDQGHILELEALRKLIQENPPANG